MEKEAVQLYKLASTIEYRFGYISLNEYSLRLINLYHLSNKSEVVKSYITELFNIENLDEFEYEDLETNDSLILIKNGDDQLQEHNLLKSENEILHYITKSTGKISKWHFIIGDADYFPSIPHGHSVKNRNIKLDSYLGYFYNVSNKGTKVFVAGRENRQYIIDLWNDKSFRSFARDHINWYLITFPNYKWRVSVKRIKVLPKKR